MIDGIGRHLQSTYLGTKGAHFAMGLNVLWSRRIHSTVTSKEMWLFCGPLRRRFET